MGGLFITKNRLMLLGKHSSEFLNSKACYIWFHYTGLLIVLKGEIGGSLGVYLAKLAQIYLKSFIII